MFQRSPCMLGKTNERSVQSSDPVQRPCVWQLMFEKILAGPGPHYYFHVLLPGGAESLGKPEFALAPGTKAPLAGTLVKIVLAQREEDSRLSLVVQVAVTMCTACDLSATPCG